jgi:CRISPR/Cas system CSM-associated protein Csm3 (group 7 of RAMP superfamily)
MARKIDSRLIIKGILTAQTPIHIGGYGESFETDMALAKNGNDEFYIPGTSLTGTLRSWFENAFGKGNTIEFWGFQEEEQKRIGTKTDRSKASFVLIDDLRLPEDLRNSLQSELRDGVGIDRHYGTAAPGAKYDCAILPKGTQLKFEMTVEMQNDTDKIKAMFGHLLEALQKGEIRLGASKTRGLGKVEIQNIKIREDKFIGFDILEILKAKTETKEEQEKRFVAFEAFKSALQKTAEGETESIYDKLKPDTGEQITIEIKWQPKSPLMVKAGYDGIGVDTLPLSSANGKEKVSLVLPGSSVKGAFRAQAERILRTFSGKSARDAKEFHDQIKMDLINELFGAKKEKNGKANLGLGALSVDDCFAEKQMNAETWQAVEAGEFPTDETYSTTRLHRALKEIDGESGQNTKPTNNFHISHHTAIDRFTGAASDGALFSVLKPSPTTVWENLHLSLDLTRFSSDENKLSSLMLLLLILRDFAQNRLPLGFAVNRGMGEVKDVSFEIKGAYNISYQNGQFAFTDAKQKEEIQTAWDNLEV